MNNMDLLSVTSTIRAIKILSHAIENRALKYVGFDPREKETVYVFARTYDNWDHSFYYHFLIIDPADPEDRVVDVQTVYDNDHTEFLGVPLEHLLTLPPYEK